MPDDNPRPAIPVTHYLGAEGLKRQARGANYWEAPLHADAASGEREQIYVPSGSFRDQNRALKAGDYACREPGAPHSSDSDEGCVALLVYTRA
jgi:hypothetical protein